MKMKLAVIMILAASPLVAQIQPEIVAGYTVNNNQKAGYNAKTIHPFVFGANLSFALTKKKILTDGSTRRYWGKIHANRDAVHRQHSG